MDDWKVLDTIISLFPQQFLKLDGILSQKYRQFLKSQEISSSSDS